MASFNWDGAPDAGGTSANANWRTNTNWNGDIVPVHPVSDIEFPAGAANLSNFNDYSAGSTFNSILMSGGGYTLQGNAITMSSGITSTIPAGSSNTVSLPISLTADQTWTSTTAGSTLDMSGGAVDLRGFTLTVNGSGTTILGPISDSTDVGGNNGIIAEGGTVVLSGDSSAAMFAGVHDATLQVLGSASQTFIDINGGTLTTDAAATTGPIQVIGVNGGRIAPGGLGTTGILSTQGNVVLSGVNGFGTSFAVDLNGTTVGSGYDALHVTGTATLGGLLNPNVGIASTTGSSYTILIATAGVSGTFIGLNDLDTFTVNGRTFQIDYTPTSVVLTDVTVEFVVNVNTDEGDANTSDGLCDTDLTAPGLQCTLRAAIQQANASADSNVIKFNIPGDGVHTISPTSALPTIINSVTIDGYTQPGASPNTLAIGNNAKLLIELNGTSGSGSAFIVNAPNNIFRGLVINRFPGASGDVGWGFRLLSAGNTIQGCYLGTNPAGDTALPNRGGGVSIEATSQPPNTPSGNNLIGGATAAARNVILGGAQGFAIDINGLNAAVFQGGIIGGDGNTVQGNYIGTNAAGSAMLGRSGIEIFTKNNTIGGTIVEARNVMFSFGGIGLNLSESNASGNTIQGNYIGINATGDAALGSTTTGVTLLRAPNNTIGGTATGAGNVISGNSFGINATDSDNLTIQGNLIGTNAAGTAAIGNNGGLAISGGSNLTIGGTTPGTGNIISGSITGHGIVLTTFTATTGDVIQGNYIGTDITGTLPLKNAGYGIQMLGQPPSVPYVIGGTTTAARNVISGNALDGISLQTSNILVQGNFIGTDVNGTAGLGNGKNGIIILGSDNAIGATTGADNRIAFNSGAGVFVAAGAGNAILGNSIFSNTGLGIDLGNTGVTANDLTPPADADTGANNLQNFPVIASAIVTGTQLTVTYSVPSDVLNSEYPLRIEFFKADAAGTQGQTLLGRVSYTAAQAGVTASPSFTPAVSLAVGDKIVATATDAAGNTSEFSAAATVQSCTTVINTDDAGLGSLRQAIICANAAPGTDTISFNIPGDGVHTISPLSALPKITDSVIIDGYTQPGASPNTNGPKQGDNANLLIELNGSGAGTGIRGLDFRSGSDGSTVRGLVINHFTFGMFLGSDGNVIPGNFIGTNPAGTAAAGTSNGVLVVGTNNRIGGTDADDGAADGQLRARNVISGCSNAGILIDQTANLVAGNLIGTKPNGTAPLANGSGIQMNFGSGNLIGGSALGAGNVISGNQIGIYITTIGEPTAGGTIQGNFIGTDVTGTANLGNTDNGVLVDGPFGFIGGTDPGTGNVIAYNGTNGIVIQPEVPALNNIRILGNSIYQNGGLGIDLNDDGPTANDTADADTGANNLQNFPVVTYATRDAGKLKVKYNVPSDSANSTYPMRVEFFLADVKGQGKTFLGSDTLTEAEHNAGTKTITLTPASPIKVFDTIVATATDSFAVAAGGGPANTSEFSPLVTIVSPWKNLNPGRLRWDVNDDTFVSADDVIAIINYINAKGSGQLPDDAANQKPYCDVDGDNNVVANDVVEIINYINAGRQQGGEADAAAGPADASQAGADSDLLALIALDMAAVAQSKRRG